MRSMVSAVGIPRLQAGEDVNSPSQKGRIAADLAGLLALATVAGLLLAGVLP